MFLKDKIAVITGGAQGLGYTIAKKFLENGAKVILLDLQDFKETEEYSYKDFYTYKINVASSKEAEECFKILKKKYGAIDILVNNAGITRDALTNKMTEREWDDVINVNLKGVFNLTKHIGCDMSLTGSGNIINISSIVGQYGNIGQVNYAASKGGVISMTKTWAKEFASKGANVRVNAIAPGYILTKMVQSVPEKLLTRFAGLTMLGRLGEPNEIAKVALFLASDLSSYVTGTVIDVNGGMRL